MKTALLVRTLLFTVLIPGTVVVYLPHAIAGASLEIPRLVLSAGTIMAGIPGLLGCALVASCMWVFVIRGEGTPAPVDPPKRLVVEGAYRFTRNPMYVGILCILASEALLAGTLSLWVYAGLVLAMFHVFVIAYEEPHLRKQFGRQYEEYCRRVPRWGLARTRFAADEGIP